MMDLHYMDQRLRSLVIFRELLMDPVIAAVSYTHLTLPTICSV